jgi:hypothetical protein
LLLLLLGQEVLFDSSYLNMLVTTIFEQIS